MKLLLLIAGVVVIIAALIFFALCLYIAHVKKKQAQKPHTVDAGEAFEKCVEAGRELDKSEPGAGDDEPPAHIKQK